MKKNFSEVAMRNIKIINDSWLFSKDAKSVPAALPAGWTNLNLPYIKYTGR